MFVEINEVASSAQVSENHKKSFIKRLLQWFESNKRVFSWREQPLTPYQILVLEIMLQRTPAERVQEISDDFFRKYPNPGTLYKASEDELRSDIQTLGLQNKKARLLKELAICLVRKYNSRVPEDFEDLLEIPGVGIYVANAVLCYSQGKIVPLIDTNVSRVIGRTFALRTSKNPSSDRHLWTFVEGILPRMRIREFNWALIDLGSLICRPRKPLCNKCPMSTICKYNKSSRLPKT